MTRVLSLIWTLASVVFVSLLLSACTALGALNALVASDSHRQATVTYGAGERRQLDVYTPLPTSDRVRPPDGWPVVVFFYGGS
ncbi:MAG: hypothetical protein H7X75_09735, partial [Burkholderiaceae bacterium]|nr:hypothetical protein [Burkholderiaceae bacterium]